jgi:glutaminyl-peptide cyclotransferase
MHLRRFLLLALLALIPAPSPVAVAQDATPAGGGCTVAPRSIGEVLALGFAPSGAPTARPAPPPPITQADELPPGEPVEAATIAAIDAVTQAYAACANTRDFPRLFALLTPSMILRDPILAATRDEARAALSAPPVPSRRPMAFGPARDARRLADARVGAAFVLTQRGLAQNVFLVFADLDGRWLIDEFHVFDVAPAWGHRVVAEYPHDRDAFTQGLVIIDGVLYEGTGLEGHSTLRRVDLETGAVLQSRALAGDLFGEGIAVLGDRIYQLTWLSETAFVYDRETFAVLETFAYEGEGWGLTTDGRRLIMSNGTDRLVFRDPVTFAELGSVAVRDGEAPVSSLNELEYVDGQIWANLYGRDRLARIDPTTGQVTGWLDLTGLLPAQIPPLGGLDVLNGIAYDAATGRLLVTGKHWPTLFALELLPPPGHRSR